MRIVAKFGGTSLGNGRRVMRAARAVRDAVEEGHEVAVVASAMGDTTDELLEEMEFDAGETDRDEILGMGERTSIRMLNAALHSLDVDSRFVEPGDPDWPVVIEDGDVDREKTRRKAAELEEELEERVLVLPGFIGVEDGSVATLDRGGSDTTAVMLGNYMDADQTAIVTDVEGIMTGNPAVVDDAENLDSITVEELRELSLRGAEVVAPAALEYESEDLDVKVVHHQHGDLLRTGTAVEGRFESLIDMREQPLACLTLAGRALKMREGILSDLSSALADRGINIDSTSTGMDSVTFYVDEEASEEAKRALHSVVVENDPLSSVTVEEGIAVLRVVTPELPSDVSELEDILGHLGERGVELHEIITSASSVALFVDWSDREEALEVLQENF